MSALLDSTILSASFQTDKLASPDVTVTLANPLKFSNAVRQQYIRLISVSLSNRIPNIYRLFSPTNPSLEIFNNGLLRVTHDNGGTWVNIQLDDGIYTVTTMAASINHLLGTLGFWTDSSDPGIEIRYHLSTQICYFTLDNSKLTSPGTLGIDLSVSAISSVLGYNDPANQIFFASVPGPSVHSADSYALFDFFGNSVNVLLRGFGFLSIKDGTRSEQVCSIPVTATGNEILYPSSGIETPLIPLQTVIPYLSEFSVSFEGTRKDEQGKPRKIHILEGLCNIDFQLLWR